MGYRSEVCIKCEQQAFNILIETAMRKLIPDEVFDDGGVYTIRWSSIKWYNSFDDVKTIENILDEIYDNHPEENGYNYHFIRLGEEIGDIEERQNGSNCELYCLWEVDVCGDKKNQDEWLELIAI